MASPVQPTAQTSIAPPTAVTPSSANASTAGAVASANAPASLTSASTISSMDDLKKKAPKLYNTMLQGIAMSICQDMEHHQDRLKKLMREGNTPAA